jgi:acyl-CoA synthetase (AMP-forming)/AMP-acid ligase II
LYARPQLLGNGIFGTSTLILNAVLGKDLTKLHSLAKLRLRFGRCMTSFANGLIGYHADRPETAHALPFALDRKKRLITPSALVENEREGCAMATELPNASNRYSAEEITSFYELGYWETDTALDLIDALAVQRPNNIFVSDSTTSLSFSQLREQAYRTAAGLVRAGIEPGDRIGIQIPNWTDFVVAVLAAARCRAVVVPMMTIYRNDEVNYILQHSGARAALTCGEFGGFNFAEMYEELYDDCPQLENIYLARANEVTGRSNTMESLMADGDLDDIIAEIGDGPKPDDGHLIIYTSGTTARPKGCFHTWNTAAFTARVMAKNLACSKNDVAFGPSPVTHGTGYITSVLIPLVSGGSSHFMEAWDPVEAIERINKYGCTTAVTATPFLQMLLDAYDSDVHDISSLRLWVAAGSPIPPAIVERSRIAVPGLEVLSLYGRSENFVTTMCNTGDDQVLTTTSDGCAPEGVEIAAVDLDGNEVTPGDEGDLAYKGPGHMIEYFRQPELNSELYTETGFSRSGDLGTINDAGYLRVTGRLKDIIIRGGMNISANEIENLILAHPSVQGVAIVAMPDEILGERACAFVVPTEGTRPSLNELTAYLREEHNMAIQKLPERLELVDALPLTAAGKVQKHTLRAEIAGKLKQEPSSASPA